MLDPKYLSDAPEEVAQYFDELETRILKDVARRIAENRYMMTSTAEYQMRKLEELGVTMSEIEKYIAETLNITEAKVRHIINEAAHQSVEKDNEIAKAAGQQIPNDINLTQAILNGIVSTNNELRNICNSMASAANKTFEHVLDQAYLSVSSGAFSMSEAVKTAVNDLAKNGISWIDYPSGAHRRVDSAIRNALRTGINQTAARCQERNLDEMDCNMVETTSHMGARPEHAVWQGKVFWRKRLVEGLSNFYEATGYGTGAGLCGWNCRHNFFPNFDGVPSFKHYDEKENERLYKAEQQQRYQERKIREWKRKKAVNKAGNVDYSKEANKIREWQNRQKQLIERYPELKRSYARETIEIHIPDTLTSAQKNAIIIREIKEKSGIIGKINITPKNDIDFSNVGFDEQHINADRNHMVTKDEAISFIKIAKFSVIRWNGRFENFVSDEGITYYDTTKHLIKTSFKKDEFNEDYIKALEVFDKRYGK